MSFDRKRYVELKVLGTGGFSTVYLCRDLYENRTVALKVIKTGKLNKKNLTRLQDEFFLLNSLRHRNLVDVFDIGYNKETNTIYYTMEYCEKVNIVKYLVAKDEETIIKAFVQILRALHFIHSHDIVHFDIKPENFGIIEDNVDFTVKLMDFGLFLPISQISKTSMRGTIFYMAPELFSKEMEKDHRVDLYSLGMVFLKLLLIRNGIRLNQKYFDIETLSDDQIGRIKEKRLFKIIEKLVAKKLSERYSSAVEVLNDVNEIYKHYFSILPPRGKEELFFEPRFVGRNNELNFLKAFLVSLEVEKHKKPFVFIRGESGIGKSRLMSEFRLHAQLQGFRVRRAFAISSDRIFDVAIQLFKKMMPIFQPEFFRHIDRDVVNIIKHAIYSEAPVFSPVLFESMDGEILSKFLYNFVDIFKKLVEESGETFLFFIEDLHNIDEFSIQFFRAFLSKKINALWLMNYRTDIKLPDCVKGFLGELENADLSQTIELKALTKEDINELIRSSFPKAFLGYKFVDFVYERTAGNPLLVAELFKTLISKEYLYIENGVWKFKEGSEVEFSEKLESIFMFRIKSLPETALEIMKYMALLVEPVSEKFLEKVVGKINVYDEIGTLLEKRMIAEFSRKYMFVHSRLKDSVLSIIEPDELAKLYLNVAKINEELGEFSFEKTAQWYLMAGEKDKAKKFFKIAFENYAGTYKNEKVIEIGNILLDLCEEIKQKKFYLKTIIRMNFFLGKANENEKYIERLKKLPLEDRDKIDIPFYEAEYFAKTGKVESALNILYDLVSEEKVKLFPVKYLPELYIKIGSLLLQEGILDQSRLFFSLAETILMQKQCGRELGTLYQYLGFLDYADGKIEDAFKKWKESEKIYRETSFLPGIATVHTNLARYYFAKCKWNLVDENLTKSIEILSNIGNISQLVEAYLLFAKAKRMEGDFLFAGKYLDSVETFLNTIDDKLAQILFNIEKAVYYMEIGEWFEAENHLIIAGTMASNSDFKKYQIIVSFYESLLDFYRGNLKDAYQQIVVVKQSFDAIGSFFEKTYCELLKIALDVAGNNFLDAGHALEKIESSIVDGDINYLKVYYYLVYGNLLAKEGRKEEAYRKLHLALALTRKNGLLLLSLIVLNAIYKQLYTFLGDDTKELIVSEIRALKKEFISKFPKKHIESLFNRRELSAIKMI